MNCGGFLQHTLSYINGELQCISTIHSYQFRQVIVMNFINGLGLRKLDGELW